MILNYCTDCGAKFIKHEDIVYTCPNGHQYWNNARTAVALIFAENGKILYAKRGQEPSKGKYDFPGGFVDPNETLEEAARREAKEELGITIDVLRYIGSAPNVYENDTHVCDAIFLVLGWSGTMAANDDVASVEWKDVDFINSDQFSCEEYKNILPQIRKAVQEQ
ncbi:MAG TPA: NUDIX domain-containing protein [Patescibacteria group bacterium]|nr:NUDIX domain-containing protein [Patescibacteria group bacterium]